MALDGFTMANLTMRNFIAGAVVIVWSITGLVTLVTKDYTSLGYITPVMTIVAGILVGTKGNGSSQRKNGEG